MHRELVAGRRACRTQTGLVQCLMRDNGIRAVQTRRFRKTTNPNHDLGYAPNLLQQDFSTLAPDCVWVGDITYI